MSRIAAVLTLLRSYESARLDIGPFHPTHTPAGFAEPVRCRACKATGRLAGPRDARRACNRCKRGVARPHGCVPCDACAGTGLQETDPYMTPAARRKRERGGALVLSPGERDAELRRLNRSLALRAGKIDEAFAGTSQERAALEEALAAGHASADLGLWLAGDYAALERALNWLKRRSARVYALCWNAHVSGGGARYPSLDPHVQSRADAAVALLARRMPATIRVPSHIRELERRRQGKRPSVQELLEAGWKVRRIALETGVSEQRVKALRRAWRAERENQQAKGEAVA